MINEKLLKIQLIASMKWITPLDKIKIFEKQLIY